jgi:hypothetical protein
MLKAEGKITDVIIENMMNWPPARRAYASESATADSTFIAARPFGRTMNRDLKIWRAEFVRRRRIIRASFSQERTTYIAADQSAGGVAKVIYQSKDGTSTKNNFIYRGIGNNKKDPQTSQFMGCQTQTASASQ